MQTTLQIGSPDKAAYFGYSIEKEETLHFSKQLYVSDSLMDRKDKVCREMKYGCGRPNVYALIRNTDRRCPEIVHSRFLKQKVYLDSPAEIVGITSSLEEAMAYLTVQALLLNQ